MSLLRDGNYRPVRIEHTLVAAKTEDCLIALYKSGKCLVQGKGAADFVSFVLEPLVLKEATLGYEDILDADAASPHMGIDESGKGDFFGPMVVASAYIDQELIECMREIDVKDSKNITSDNKALDMGRAIRKALGKRFAIVKIGPTAYNRLYAKMRSVNSILSWAHARAIENLLENVPSCPRAISDQFGKKEQVQAALMKKGRQIELIQRHKAESDMAVAAASVLAREMFLRELAAMRDKYGIEFPKGASEKVKSVAGKLIEKTTPMILLETAKCHFKTTDEVLAGLGTDRNALGPEGQAKSRSYNGPYSRPKKAKGAENV
ncbi:MAG: ribonuclease HIII [Lentisphaerae bacterium]|nr:ribonuclease HIII [Lentisphaerota bacterium]